MILLYGAYDIGVTPENIHHGVHKVLVPLLHFHSGEVAPFHLPPLASKGLEMPLSGRLLSVQLALADFATHYSVLCYVM